MNTAAISNNQSVTMNSVNANKKVNWMERFRAYLLDNAEYFAAGSAMMRKCFCSSADHENSKTIKQREKKLRFAECKKIKKADVGDGRSEERTYRTKPHPSVGFFEFQQKHEKIIAESLISW